MGASFRTESGRPGSRRSYRPLAEINVTPLVDVMLVLLIVFMVTAPLLSVGVPVDLPKTAAAQLSDRVEPLVVSVDANGGIFLQETAVTLETLAPRLQAVTENKPDTIIYVRGDKGIPYGQVMTVMGAIAAAGYQRVSLVAEFPDETGRGG